MENLGNEMCKGPRKITNKKQLEKLVEIMKENPQIGKGVYKKSQIIQSWTNYADEFNSLGPPSRSAENWLTFNTKKKLINNRRELKATGGGPNTMQSFTPLEEEVIDFLNLNTSVNPPGKAFGLRNSNEDSVIMEVANEENCPEPLQEIVPNTINISGETGNTNSSGGGRERIRSTIARQARAKENISCERIKLLEELSQSQRGFYEEVKSDLQEIKTYFKELSEYKKKNYYMKKDANRELLKLKKKKLEILEKEVQQKREDRVPKLRLKKEILEISKREKDLLNDW